MPHWEEVMGDIVPSSSPVRGRGGWLCMPHAAVASAAAKAAAGHANKWYTHSKQPRVNITARRGKRVAGVDVVTPADASAGHDWLPQGVGRRRVYF